MQSSRHNSFLWYLPTLLLLGTVMVYPLLRTFTLSFYRMDATNSFHTDFVGAANLLRLAVDSRFRETLLTTVRFTATSVSIEFVLGLAVALCADTWIRGRSAIRTVLLIPWMLPTAVIAVLWTWIFNDQYGIVNSLLLRTRLLQTPVSWLGNPSTAFSAIVIADVWKTTPFVFLILLAGLQAIPHDMYEAIEIDGGGVWAKFKFITWPFLKRFVFVAVVFRVIQAFSVFDLVYVMTGGGPGGSTETLSVYAYQTMMRYLDFGYAATVSTTTVVVLALLALSLYWILVARNEELL